MDQQLYLEIVEHYIRKADLEYNHTVRAEALRWCQARGSVQVVRHTSSQNTGSGSQQLKWYNSLQIKSHQLMAFLISKNLRYCF